MFSLRISVQSSHHRMNLAASQSIALRPLIDANPWGEIRNPPICTTVSANATHSVEQICMVEFPMCDCLHSLSVFLWQSDQDHKILPERSGLVRPEIGD